jgi:hypothetical protein
MSRSLLTTHSKQRAAEFDSATIVVRTLVSSGVIDVLPFCGGHGFSLGLFPDGLRLRITTTTTATRTATVRREMMISSMGPGIKIADMSILLA